MTNDYTFLWQPQSQFLGGGQGAGTAPRMTIGSDPLSRYVIPRKDVVDFGHKKGKDYDEMFKKYVNREISLQELKDFQANWKNFRLELPSENRNHKHE